MLQNAYFLAKIGADTAENEQHFADDDDPRGDLAGALARVVRDRGAVRRRLRVRGADAGADAGGVSRPNGVAS